MENVRGGQSLFERGVLIANRYEVLSSLGAGAMGVVLRVCDRALDNEVCALKLLYPHLVKDSTVFGRFRTEVLIARRLSHPNIVRTYDFGDAGGGYYYISMEYVRGVSLKDRIYDSKYEPLKFDEILRILYEAGQGLAHAHRRDVVHRDIKPDNILLSDASEVRLTDFGLARLMHVDRGFTQTGETVGTPCYMAPEQIRGDAVDGRADIYGLGIVAYEMVVGEKPFFDECWLTLANMHLKDPLPAFDRSFGVPKWFQEFVFVSTAKDPNERYASADDWCDEIVRHINRDHRKEISPAVFSNYHAQQVRARISRQRLGRYLRNTIAAVIIFGICALGVLLVRTSAALSRGALSTVVSAERTLGMSLAPIKALFGVNIKPDNAALLAAVEQGDERRIALLLAAGADPNTRDGEGAPVLQLAVAAQAKAAAALLLGAGAEADLADARGKTALMIAAGADDVPMLTALLDAQANVDVRDAAGMTAIMHAARTGRLAAVQELRRRGAFVNAKDNTGRAVLVHAVQGGSVPVVQELLDRGAPINEKDREGKTALIYAAEGDRLGMMQALLSRGADSSTAALTGKSAWDYASAEGRKLLGQYRSPQRSEPPRGASTPETPAAPRLTTLRIVGKIERSLVGRQLQLKVRVRNAGDERAEGVAVTVSGIKPIPLSGPTEISAQRQEDYLMVVEPADAPFGVPLEATIICSNCRR